MTSNKDKLLILDLDSTLIHSEVLTIDNLDSSLNTFVIKDESVNLFLVKERPFLRKFIFEANKYFKLGVWTASEGYYADAIIANLFDGIDLEVRYLRNQCKVKIDEETKNVTSIIKPISKILDDNKTFNVKNTLIVDDNKMTFSENPNNAIHISSWTGQENDDKLYVLMDIIRMAAELEDVRKIGEVWTEEQKKKEERRKRRNKLTNKV